MEHEDRVDRFTIPVLRGSRRRRRRDLRLAPLAHTLDPRIQGDQLKNRLVLKDGLEEQGLVNYENEWWHFTFKPEPYPDTYFDFPVDPSSLGH